MRNLTEVVNNKLLNDIVDETVRQALKLQREADKVREEQKAIQSEGKPYNYSQAVRLEEGVSALSNILWTVFGGMPIDSIQVIQRISRENTSDMLGYDCQDYVGLFMDEFQGR